jgi:group I intron endonuclease
MSNIIYQLKNKINGKIYIGKTTQSVMTRFHKHCHASLKDSNTLIHKAIRKYGKENFEVTILECPLSINDAEKRWISKRKPDYNLTAGGDGISSKFSSKMQKQRWKDGTHNWILSNHERIKNETHNWLGRISIWKHTDGRVFEGRLTELIRKFSTETLNSGHLSQVRLGNRNHHKGWSLYPPNVESDSVAIKY